MGHLSSLYPEVPLSFVPRWQISRPPLLCPFSLYGRNQGTCLSGPKQKKLQAPEGTVQSEHTSFLGFYKDLNFIHLVASGDPHLLIRL